MGFLERLKTILEINAEFDQLMDNTHGTIVCKGIDFSKTANTVQITADKVLIIDPTKLSLEQKQAVGKLVLSDHVEQNGTVLERESATRTRVIQEHLPTGTDAELLTFYENKLSPAVHTALEAALVVKRIAESGGNIDSHKYGIAQKFPLFGNNICNLASAGYFHENFLEIYKNMVEKGEWSIARYQQEIEQIIFRLPTVEFVHQYVTFEDELEKITGKIRRLKRYGASRLDIHGLGKKNVQTCVRIEREIRKLEEVADTELQKEGSAYIKITVILKRDQ